METIKDLREVKALIIINLFDYWFKRSLNGNFTMTSIALKNDSSSNILAINPAALTSLEA